ncbi:E3 ubiquitin ligase TRAF3IP2-like isoform X1 [Branchiostoma floridae x Branchiostoma japonicum]
MATAGTTGLNPGPPPHMHPFRHYPYATSSGRQNNCNCSACATRPKEQPQAQASPPPSLQRPAPIARKESVFITYSDDGQLHLSMVLDMAYHLHNQGYNVQVDMFQRHFMGMDKMAWLDDKVENSDFILVVCSPKYRRDVDGSGPHEDDDHGLNTRYINRAMQTVFLENSCNNYKVIPVLLKGYTRETCPRWLRNTLLYRWPRDVQDIMCRLRREERYKMPAGGRPPVLTVRRDFT